MMIYDVAVIGAGPAGSTGAKYCAERGMKTLLIDRCSFPRSKTCGGGVTTAALNTFGFPLPSQAILGRIRRLQSFFGDQNIDIDYPRQFMVTIDRSVLDSYLAEKAVESGAEFRQSETLTGLDKEKDMYLVRTQNGSHRARAIIGADGVHSATARLTGLSGSRNIALCLTAEIEKGTDSVSDETIRIHYNLVPKGYGWVFPKGERLSLGVGSLGGKYSTLRKTLGTLLQSIGAEMPSGLKGHYIPMGSDGSGTVSDGVILTGDAAGFVDPFTGEGIRFAVISGMLAGETICGCLEKGLPLNKQNLAAYQKKCRQAFIKDFKYSFLLSRAFFTFPAQMHRLVFRNSDIFNGFLNILEGRNTYSSLLRDVVALIPRTCFSRT